MLKAGWNNAAAVPHRNLADAHDKVEHRGKRKMFAHTFAAKTVVTFEPARCENLSTFMGLLDHYEKVHKRVNMRRVLNYMLVGLFGQLFYGHKLGCLCRGDIMLDAESRDGRIYRVLSIDSLLDATVINNLLAIFSHMSNGGDCYDCQIF